MASGKKISVETTTETLSFGELSWVTKDGRTIPVRELTDDHLENIMNGLIAGTLFPGNPFVRAWWMGWMQNEARRRGTRP